MAKVNGKWPFARIVERKGRIVRDHVWVNAHPPDGDSRLEPSRILALPVVSDHRDAMFTVDDIDDTLERFRKRGA